MIIYFKRYTHIKLVSSKSIVSLVAYFRAKSIAEKLFTARRLTSILFIDNKTSITDLILHIDAHINGVISVNEC